MAAAALPHLEPTKTKKPPKLFSVTGDASGVRVKLSAYADGKLTDAIRVLESLFHAGGTFPKSAALAESITLFLMDPTAKPAAPKP